MPPMLLLRTERLPEAPNWLQRAEARRLKGDANKIGRRVVPAETQGGSANEATEPAGQLCYAFLRFVAGSQRSDSSGLRFSRSASSRYALSWRALPQLGRRHSAQALSQSGRLPLLISSASWHSIGRDGQTLHKVFAQMIRCPGIMAQENVFRRPPQHPESRSPLLEAMEQPERPCTAQVADRSPAPREQTHQATQHS
jgi:hypothetical protein